MPDARTCATCDHWQQYIPGLGECLDYVKRRQEAFARADDMAAFRRDWPAKPAPDTASDHSCDRYAPAAAGSISDPNTGLADAPD